MAEAVDHAGTDGSTAVLTLNRAQQTGRYVVIFALLAAVIFAFTIAHRLPAPASNDAPATEFSEARALATVLDLTSLGPHPIGSPRAHEAAQRLLARLQTIPGVEAEIAVEHRIEPWPTAPWVAIGYDLENVVARLHGTSATDDALLLSGHYDSTPYGPGAGDNAVGAAVAIETLRALASGPRPTFSLVVLLDGGEEVGLLGALAFSHHRFARTIRGFINLESLGRGPSSILRSPADGGAFLRAVAAVLPRPFANPITHDLAQFADLRFVETDYSTFRDRLKVSGIDLAHTRGAEHYHGPDDVPANLEAGSVQDMGDGVLALVRAFTAKLPVATLGGEWSAYATLLGKWLLVVQLPTLRWLGRGLGLGAFAFVIGAFVARRRQKNAGFGVLSWCWRLGLASVFSIGAPTAVAALLPSLGRVHAWTQTPVLGMFAFVLFAFVGWQATLGRALGKTDAEHGRPLIAAALIGWTPLTLLAAEKGVRTSLIMILAGYAWLLIGIISPSLRRVVSIVATALVLAFVADALATPIWSIGPLAQMSFIPIDLGFAGACGLVVAFVLPLLAPLFVQTRGVLIAFVVLLTSALVLALIVFVPNPYTPARPVHLLAIESRGLVRLAATEPVPLERVIPVAADGVVAAAVTSAYPYVADFTHELRIAPFDRPARLRIEVVSLRDDLADPSTRRAHLRITGMSAIRLSIKQRNHVLRGWSVTPELAKTAGKAETFWAFLDGDPRSTWELDLDYAADRGMPVDIYGLESGATAFDATRLNGLLGAKTRSQATSTELYSIVLPPRR